MYADDIKSMIETGLHPSTAIVSSEDNVHFSATVISPEFIDKSRIQKQQLVYATLGNHLTDGTIHAISIKTLTPEEWHQLKEKNHG